jgi:hypothetical protein
MRLVKILFLGVALAAIAGCRKPGETPAATAQTVPAEPTRAQPKLPTMKLYVGSQTLDTELALTPEQEQTGMMFRTNILDTDSMIFVLPYPMQASFWMKNCPESISAAYITPDGVIAEIRHFERNDTNPVLSAVYNIQYVLETSEGWFDRHHVTTGMMIQTEHGSLADSFVRK